MKELLTLKVISIALIFFAAILAGFFPFKKRLKIGKGLEFPAGQALAAGIFLGAGLIHMLGDAATQFYQLNIHYPLAFLLAGLTFLLLLFLEHLSRELYEHQGDAHAPLAILAMVMLSIHSLLAGAALGLDQHVTMVILLLIAILAHKWAASFALAIQINRTTLKFKTGVILFVLFTLMTPLGIVIGNSITSSVGQYPLLPAIFSSLAAGTFLYLGTLHGLAKSFMVQKCCNLKHFLLVIVGFALMAAVALFT